MAALLILLGLLAGTAAPVSIAAITTTMWITIGLNAAAAGPQVAKFVQGLQGLRPPNAPATIKASACLNAGGKIERQGAVRVCVGLQLSPDFAQWVAAKQATCSCDPMK